MINFDEELKKFKPCLEVDDVEDAIYGNDIKDISDIMQEMINEMRNRQNI